MTTKAMTIHFCYPHFVNRLENSFTLYLMQLPVGKTENRSFSLLFLKPSVPSWLLTALHPVLQPMIVQLLLSRFLKREIEMIESEQENYLKNPQRRYVEVDPAILALQRLTLRQYEIYLQSQRQEMKRSLNI